MKQRFILLLLLFAIHAGGSPAPQAEDLFLGSGTFLIRSSQDYRYLTIKDATPVAGSVAFLKSYTDRDVQQRWRFVPRGEGYYKIRSESGLCLTDKRVLAPTLDPENNEDNQLWKVSRLQDGYYSIQCKTNKYLAVTDRNRREDALTGFQTSFTNAEVQKWHLIKWSGDGRRMTSFVPAQHGFQFANTFRGVDASYRYGGLCGGMVYSAMDYFRARKSVPPQNFKPANRTPLQSYIYARQNDAAMVNQLDKWAELRTNPFGWRDSEFFEWGLKGTGGGRWEELLQLINASNPAPLGLYEGGTANYSGQKSGDHQVLAVGYSAGRYRGDGGDYKQEMKIFIYDPNYPGRTMTLMVDAPRKCFFYVESGSVWRTYFVDRKYAPKTPPDPAALQANQPDGSITHLYATFETGGDDLRGGNDVVNLTVNFRDGSSQTFQNLNASARWVDNNDETVPLVLRRPVSKADIASFTITTTFSGGIGGDNWNLDNFYVTNGGNLTLVCANCDRNARKPLFRFTGDQKSFTVPVQ